jgi:hypothetical protein
MAENRQRTRRLSSSSSEDERRDWMNEEPIRDWAAEMERVDPSTPTEPTTTCPDVAPPVAASTLECFVSPATRQLIADASGSGSNRRCGACGKEFKCRRKLRRHCARHFTALFCSCGFTSQHWEDVLAHRRQKGCHRQIYQVDDSRHSFIDTVGPTQAPQCIVVAESVPQSAPLASDPLPPRELRVTVE